MSYRYEDLRPQLFTESGQVMFLQIRDRVKTLLETAGAARMQEIMRTICGDTWMMLACVDRLVELAELREVTAGQNVAGQDRIYVGG